jgi:hypothetical protein
MSNHFIFKCFFYFENQIQNLIMDPIPYFYSFILFITFKFNFIIHIFTSKFIIFIHSFLILIQPHFKFINLLKFNHNIK